MWGAPMETALNYLDDKIMYISTDEPKWKNRLLKLAEERPGEITITNRPEDNGGCLFCKCPANWLKISPPRAVKQYSDEELEIMRERMKLASKARHNVDV